MPEVSIQYVATALVRKRGDRGLREVAKEIGISPSTLSRIENGKVPDLKTYQRVCGWLGIEHSGSTAAQRSAPGVSVHFKKDQAIRVETAQALAEMIVAAQQQLMRDLEVPASEDKDVREGV